jgi:hypothetical protein
MLGKWLLSATLLLGFGDMATAFSPFPPRVPPVQQPVGLEGPWYYEGDPRFPCYVQIIPDPREPRLIFTNEKGEQTEGIFIRGGTQVLAYGWGGGGLVGDLRHNAILWHNGTSWVR